MRERERGVQRNLTTPSIMARTRNALKRQKVATVQSALFNPDVVFLLAGLLDARDLCQVLLTCKTLGGRLADAVEHSGLSLVEEASRRMFERASVWERSCLRKQDDEGWIELYHHLLMLRSKLTFDQLAGANIQYGMDQSTVQNVSKLILSSALCSNHVMRCGRHFAVFTRAGDGNIGIVRPVKINESDFDNGGLIDFSPGLSRFWRYLIGKQTERWGDSNVHGCSVSAYGNTRWYDWTIDKPSEKIDGFQRNAPVGLLLDLDEGALSLYQNSQRLATLKDGLSGEYCWYASVCMNESITIERDLSPVE